MPDLSDATRATLDVASRALAEHRVTGVTYYGFDHYGEDWDHGDHHDATMGVELETDGGPLVACWGDAFGRFGLELHRRPADELFRNHPRARSFTSHAWWAPFVGVRPGAELVWRTGHVDSGAAAPVALLLTGRGGARVWVACAERGEPAPHGVPPMAKGGFLLGMDNVIVTASEEFATSIGVNDP